MKTKSAGPTLSTFGFLFPLILLFASAQIAHAQRTVLDHVTSAGNNGGATPSDTTRKLEVNGTVKIRGRGFFLDETQGMRAGGGKQMMLYPRPFSAIVLGSGDANDYLVFNAGGSERARLTTNGDVGIGTTSPAGKLDVRGSQIHLGVNGGDYYVYDNTFNTAFTTNATATSYVNYVGYNGGTTQFRNFEIYNGKNSLVMAVDGVNSRVGIGTTSPGTKLDVNGTISATNVIAKFQDVAEWVPSSEQLSAGTVVVLDSTKSNHVTSSRVIYDTRVAGVVSEQPGIALGEKSDGKVLVATTGRVRVKVDATKSPIHIGDLLVTSDVLGFAMKSEAVSLGGVQIHRPGTLIGKALEPLEKGKGEILVLLSLQ